MGDVCMYILFVCCFCIIIIIKIHFLLLQTVYTIAQHDVVLVVGAVVRELLYLLRAWYIMVANLRHITSVFFFIQKFVTKNGTCGTNAMMRCIIFVCVPTTA